MSNQSAPEIVIIADGWRKSTFLDLLSKGDLEEISSNYLEDGVLFRDVVSNVPSVSIASHTSILTGSYQDEHHIPGHRWQSSDFSCCRDYLSLLGPYRANHDISGGVSTFLEDSEEGVVRIAVQSVIRRGAQVQSTIATQKANRILDRLGSLVVDNPRSRAVAWLPRVDSLSHLHGPDAPVVAEEMRQSSKALGALALKLKKASLWDEARILIVPDHGHREVKYQSSLSDILQDIGLRALVNTRKVSEKYTIARTSGDASAYVYFSDSDMRFADEFAEALSFQKEVAFTCLREGNVAQIFSKVGKSVLRIANGNPVSYEVCSGSDPIGLTSIGQPLTSFGASPLVAGPYPDFLHQYARSHVYGRSADLLVFAENDTHFGVVPRVGWRLGYHRGTHGGPSRDEVIVSAVYKGDAQVDGNVAVRSARILQAVDFK